MVNRRSSSAGLPPDLPSIPDGWDYFALAALVDEARGISYGVVQPGKSTPHGVPIVRVNNIRDGQVNTSDILRIAPDVEAQYARTRLRGGEVLLTLVGTLGEVASVPPTLAGWNTARAVAVIPVRSDIGATWVSLALRAPLARHYAHVWATTTVQATLNLRDVARLPVPVPPATERAAIARILGALEDKIELNRRMNQTLEAIAAALFKAWFVDFEPVYAKMEGRRPVSVSPAIASRFPNEVWDFEGQAVPAGWEVRALDSVAEFLNGLAMQKHPPMGHGDLPVIKIAELRRGNTDGSDLAGATFDRRYLVDSGDLLFSWSGTLEVRVWTGGRGALNQHLFKVTPFRCPQWFIYFWLLEHLPAFRAIAAGKATTMGHIQRHHLTTARVIMPPADLLDTTDQVFTPLIRRVVLNDLESRTLASLRDTLLPKLLSGEIRVREAESLIGAAV